MIRTNKSIRLAINLFLVLIATQYPQMALGQGEWPSAVDLQAAYCSPYVNGVKKEYDDIVNSYPSIKGTEEQMESIKIAEAAGEVSRNSLKNYLLSRLSSINSNGRLEMTAAVRAGEHAYAVDRRIRSFCSAKMDKSGIQPMGKEWSEAHDKCIKDNGSPYLRLEKCRDLSWLPY